MIRDATPADYASLAEVYNHYIVETVVTFEVTPISTDEMGRRVEGVAAGHPWIVLQTDHGVQGYAYARPWHERAAYRHTLETSVYLAPDARGQGHGTRLYCELFRRLAPIAPHVLIAGVTLPNEASVALHEKLGYVKSAHFREVGRKFDRWLDVGYWQKTLPNATEHA